MNMRARNFIEEQTQERMEKEINEARFALQTIKESDPDGLIYNRTGNAIEALRLLSLSLGIIPVEPVEPEGAEAPYFNA
jgi:hypothetical protein